ncbi:MAG: alpha/beta fold hydrolase [Myxococcota bacterium]|nr:alpha/beta fold hydrolase [Myxococcota bacterium]
MPSFGRSVSDFNELAIGLSEAGHRTIAWQPRGIDGSTLPSGEIDLLDSAGDVLAVLDAELLERSILVGHAYGNRVARAFASVYPDRVADWV